MTLNLLRHQETATPCHGAMALQAAAATRDGHGGGKDVEKSGPSRPAGRNTQRRDPLGKRPGSPSESSTELACGAAVPPPGRRPRERARGPIRNPYARVHGAAFPVSAGAAVRTRHIHGRHLV